MMVFTPTKRKMLIGTLKKASTLCMKHEYPFYGNQIVAELIPVIQKYDGPDCQDLLNAFGTPEFERLGVDTIETVVCTYLSNYIHRMSLRDIRKDLPPFAMLNYIVMENKVPIETFMFTVCGRKQEQCCEAGVPIEFLHVLIRAYRNQMLLMGFRQEIHKKEYGRLFVRENELGEQYVQYPKTEIERVEKKYGMKITVECE